MPTQDELLLKFAQEGASGVASASGDVAKSLDKIIDAEKQNSKAGQDSANADKQRVIGLADLKAGLDLVSNAGGKVIDFIKESIDETMKYNKSVRDLAQNLGITTEETSRIIQTADDFTVSQEAVTSALQMAVKKGMAPNIDTLAKMADEYNSIADPTERATRLTEVFGRNWTALTPMLKEGGAAIREAAASQDDALIVTEAQSKATRDLEKNMDNFGDKVTAVKLKIGNGLIPVLNSLADAADKIMFGQQDLSEAFIGTAQKLQDQLASGEITAQQYNSAIQGMAFNVKLWDANTGNALQSQYMLNDAQIQNIQNFYQQTGAINMQALAQQNAQRIAETAAQADAIRAQGMNDQRDAILAEDAAMAEYNRKLELKAAADKVAAEAEAVHRGEISQSITTLDTLAQSLAKATDAQAKQTLAQANISTIIQAQKDGKISAEEAAKATETVMLNYGLATEKSLAMAKAQTAVTEEFLKGKTTIDEFVDSAGKIPKIAADGKLSLDELTSIGIKSYEGIKKYQTQAMDETSEAIQQSTQRVTDTIGRNSRQTVQFLDLAKVKAQDVDNFFKSIPDVKTAKLIIDVEVKGDPIPAPLPGRAYGGPVSAGMPYMVGERGPEMFVPSQNGNIIPNQTNYYSTQYNVTTDRTGLAYMFERQRMAEARM